MDLIDKLRSMAEYPLADAKEGIKPREALLRKIDVRQHAILTGPPGTGKTKLLLDIKDELEKYNQLGIFKLIQFHREFSYQDFIDGYKPTGSGFEDHPGVFREFLENVEKRISDSNDDSIIDLFGIDEINRADQKYVQDFY